MALVIKKWYAEETPDENGNYVHIIGREAGLFSFILSIVGIDPITDVQIKEDNIEFKQSSLAGTLTRMIPLRSITSSFFQFNKPWKEALWITLILGSILIGFILGPLYYFLNKSLTIAVVEQSGWLGAFSFKRSVIEGKNLDEEEAYRVISIIKKLILKKST